MHRGHDVQVLRDHPDDFAAGRRRGVRDDPHQPDSPAAVGVSHRAHSGIASFALEGNGRIRCSMGVEVAPTAGNSRRSWGRASVGYDARLSIRT